MIERTLSRIVVIYSLSFVVAGLTGCSVFSKKSETETAANTAYYVCAGCHGSDNVRVNFMPPNIIGQKKGYIATTLRDYRDKKRLEPLMNGAVANLSDQEIENLAAYYANPKSRH
jgi:cytochrome c553